MSIDTNDLIVVGTPTISPLARALTQVMAEAGKDIVIIQDGEIVQGELPKPRGITVDKMIELEKSIPIFPTTYADNMPSKKDRKPNTFTKQFKSQINKKNRK